MRNNRLKWLMRVGAGLAGLLLSFWSVARAEIEALSSSVILDRFRDIPVEMATGELKLSPAPDLVVKSRGLNFDVTRNYRSQRTDPGPFGYNWNWSHGERLIIRGFELVDIITPTVTLTTYKSLICTSVVQYAHSAASSNGSWENPDGVKGEPDAWSGWGHYAYNFNGSPQDVIEGYGWGFTNIPGVCITGVWVMISGAVEKEFSHCHGLQLRLSAAGYTATNLYWSHKAYDWDLLDITAAKTGGWTWDEVNFLRVRTDLPLWNQGNGGSVDAFIDSMGVQVTYVAVSETNKEFVLPKGAPFRLVEIGSPATGYKLVYRDGRTSFFDANGQLTKKTDSSSNTFYFTYNSPQTNLLLKMSNTLGQVLAFSYNASSNITNVVFSSATVSNHSCSYAYDGNQNLTSFRDLEGNTTRYEYLTNQVDVAMDHNVTRIFDPESNVVTVTYYDTDRVRSYFDKVSNEIQFVYSPDTTYSIIPGSGSFQGVMHNSSNDIIHVFIREGDFSLDQNEEGDFSVTRTAGSVTSASGWTNANNAIGAEDGQVATKNLATGERMEVGGWGCTEPGLSNRITRVVLCVRGMADGNVQLTTASGTAVSNWSGSTLGWVELDVTGDRNNWSWQNVNELQGVITKGSNEYNANVSIDAFRLKVTCDDYNPGKEIGDKCYSYDRDHNILTAVQNNRSMNFKYDDKCNLIQKKNEDGETWRYRYDPILNKITNTVDPKGYVTATYYDKRGNPTNVVDALNNRVQMSYATNGNLIKVIDPLMNWQEYAYDAQGMNVVSQRNKRGYWTTFRYDGLGNMTNMIDAGTNVVKMRYNKYNQKVWEQDQAGIVTEYYYNKNGSMTNAVADRGTNEISLRSDFDAEGRLVAQYDGEGYPEYYRYDVYGNKTSQVDRLSNVTFFRYDRYGRASEVVDALGNTNKTTYDGNGNVLSTTDKRGFTTWRTYNQNNEMVTLVDPFGNIVTNSYDANGNKIKEELATKLGPGTAGTESLVVRYQYDMLNRLVSKTVGYGRSDARTTTSVYDELGRVVRETDPLGNYKITQYNENGQPTNAISYNAQGVPLARSAVAYDSRDLPIQTISYASANNSYTSMVEYDNRGLKVADINPTGSRTEYVYDSLRRLMVVSNSVTGAGIRYSYDRNRNKTSEVDPRGITTTTYGWDKCGRMTNKVTGVGRGDERAYAYEYDALGGLVKETRPDGGGIRLITYDAAGNVLTERDGMSNTTTYAYDCLNRVTNIIDAADGRITKEYDGRGGVRKLVDKNNQTNLYSYNAFGELTEVVNPLGQSVIYSYDKKGNKNTEMDALRLQTDFRCDGLGRVTNKVVGSTLKHSISFKYEYDWLGHLTKEIDPLGNFTETTYDGNGNVLTVKNKLGKFTQFQYDAAGRRTNVVDALQHHASFGYDAMNNLIWESDLCTNITRYTYDAYAQKSAVMNVVGTNTFAYDRLGRLTSVTDALGNSEDTGYDANGNVVSKHDKAGNDAFFYYDKLNQVTTTVDQLGYTTSKKYDAMGNVLETKDKRHNPMTYVYDVLGRVIKVTDPASHSVTNEYDAIGNKTYESDSTGLKTRYDYDQFHRLVRKVVGYGRTDARIFTYEYDDLGQLTKETDPLHYSATVVYDANGNKICVTDKNGNQTHIYYDDLNRVAWTLDPLGYSNSVVYDCMGRILVDTDKRGNASINGYDGIGRLISSTDAEGNTTHFEYDAAGNRTAEINATGVVTRVYYNALGLATNKVIDWGLPDARTLSFEYDKLGRQVKAVNPLKSYVVTEYDANGNVTNAATYSAAHVFLRNTTFEYDSRNLLVKKTDAKGIEYTYEYDAAGRKTAEHLPIGDIVYTYDIYGNPVSIEDPEHATTQMVYDKRNQKDRVIDALGHQTTYTYDGNGNVIAVMDDNGHSVLTRYDAMNHVIEVNKSMVDVLPATLKRADINGDGTVDESDVGAMDE